MVFSNMRDVFDHYESLGTKLGKRNNENQIGNYPQFYLNYFLNSMSSIIIWNKNNLIGYYPQFYLNYFLNPILTWIFWNKNDLI